MRRTILPWILVPVLTILLLVLFSYFAPLELASVTAYAGITLGLAGLVSLIKPLSWFGIPNRLVALAVAGGGVLLLGAALLWPVQTTRVAAPRSMLDSAMPEYHFTEVHEVRVPAAPDRALAAIREVTNNDIAVGETLMRIRGWFVRGGGAGKHPSLGSKRVLDVMQNPRSPFFPLPSAPREIVMGMAGRPWANSGRRVTSLAEFAAFRDPASVKIAFNLKVEDEGGGWSRVSTETRICATDDEARRKMARYWRLVYPGSGMIRRWWLNAIRRRAQEG